MTIGIHHCDCMDFMRDKPDGYYDLAIVDPPYGGGGRDDRPFQEGPAVSGSGSTDTARLNGEIPPPEEKRDADGRKVREVRVSCARTGDGRTGTGNTPPRAEIRAERRGGTWAAKYGGRIPPPTDGEQEPPVDASRNIEFWDFAPPKEYFDELFRVSKNQIIWGGNYFALPPTRCFLVWRKLTISEKFTMAMAEYAWTSFNRNAKVFECAPQGTAKEQRFHACQKPIALYTWCLTQFAEKGMKLLDTHGGSMSSAVAAYNLGMDMDVCEINEFYYRKGKERVEKVMRQLMLDL